MLTRKQGKMCIHEFEKQTASNLFENAIHTFQAKQSVFFILLFVVFFFCWHSFTLKWKYFKVENVALAASQKEWDLNPALHQEKVLDAVFRMWNFKYKGKNIPEFSFFFFFSFVF